MQNNDKKIRKKKIVFPKGKCNSYDCCADCVYMDLNEVDSYGYAWCGKYRKYYSPSQSAQSCFSPR